jgi:hypothetical protein
MWWYWHAIEYFRIEQGARVPDHVEIVDDQGPYVCGGAEEYTRLVADEYLARYATEPGRWLIVLWRLDDAALAKTKRLCEIEIAWRGRQPTISLSAVAA